MSASREEIAKLSNAIINEIPASSIHSFLQKYLKATERNGGSCGNGCGVGCCGAGCKNAEMDGLVIDRYGYTEISTDALDDIGKNRLSELKQTIVDQLSSMSRSF